MGIIKGDRLSYPRCSPRAWASATVWKPPMPLEMSTPQRFRSSRSRSRPLSAIAWSAAMRAIWVKRSIFLHSRLPSSPSASRFLTSPASLTFMLLA